MELWICCLQKLIGKFVEKSVWYQIVDVSLDSLTLVRLQFSQHSSDWSAKQGCWIFVLLVLLMMWWWWHHHSLPFGRTRHSRIDYIARDGDGTDFLLKLMLLLSTHCCPMFSFNCHNRPTAIGHVLWHTMSVVRYATAHVKRKGKQKNSCSVDLCYLGECGVCEYLPDKFNIASTVRVLSLVFWLVVAFHVVWIKAHFKVVLIATRCSIIAPR